MENAILKSKFIEVLFDKDTNIYTSKFLPATEYMTDKEWQEQMTELKILLERYKPSYIIDDNRDRLYSYSPEMQAWTLSIFIESWNKFGLKKYAQIIPTEIVGKLTSQQIEDIAVKDFKMQYEHMFFNDYLSALNWIKEVK